MGKETANGHTLVDEWIALPENTARTVIVTMFGDTIRPVTSLPSVWLAQVFKLTECFGFSERLVRTSMFRLVSEDWLTNERVGRQSRYALTPSAAIETDKAAERIYRSIEPEWLGQWSVVFLNTPELTDEDRARLAENLRWHGFFPLAGGLLASPTSSLERARELCGAVIADTPPPMGTFEFSDLDDVVSSGFFDGALEIEEITAAYQRFIEMHTKSAAIAGRVDGKTAFALRTMLIQDVRRIRLRGPDIPAALLAPKPVNRDARKLATDLYHRLSKRAAPWLSETLDVDYPTHFRTRFSTTST